MLGGKFVVVEHYEERLDQVNGVTKGSQTQIMNKTQRGATFHTTNKPTQPHLAITVNHKTVVMAPSNGGKQERMGALGPTKQAEVRVAT